jgi:hypothetical protein
MTLQEDDIYHIRHDGKVIRAIYHGIGGKAVHWFSDADNPVGGHFFLNESEFVLLGEQTAMPV